MGVKVSANGLTIVHVGSGGKAMADIPDFCKTPVGTSTPPLPYPNKAESKKLDTGLCSITVSADGGNAIAVMGAMISESTGDKAGVCGGVVSGGTEGKGLFFTFSPDVIIEGRPVIRKTDKLIMNDINTICLSGIDQADLSPPSAQTMDLEIELTDDDGNPIADEAYLVKHSGRVTAQGNLDSNGKAMISGLSRENYKIIFPNRENVNYSE